MKNNTQDPDDSNRLAKDAELARYDAVRWIEEAVKSGIPLYRAIQNAAVRPWGGRTYSVPTLERWYYAYRGAGFDALRLRERADKGRAKALSPETCDALTKCRKEHPELNITSLVRQMETTGVITPGSVSISTIYRHFARIGLDKRTMKALQNTVTSGPTKAFEFAFSNQLWMTDAMTGPVLRVGNGPVQKTCLLAFIDDCSRVCPHGQYYPAERLEFLLDCFKHAIRARGVPEKLYTDNGGIFTSRHVQTICATLNVGLIHHKPYHAWSKEIERWFLTVQHDFEQRLIFQPVSSIVELNSRFWQWLNAEYHQRKHGSLDGQSPSDRFAERAGRLKLVDDDIDLEGLFLARTTRRVRMDATISLEGKVFEVPVALRGRDVDVRYDPFAFARVEIWLNDQFVGKAKLCDKYLNSRTFEKENYEKPE